MTLNVLNRKIKVTFDDVLREVFMLFSNAMTPDIQSVREALSELAVQTKDGKWMLKPKIKERLSQHDTIVEILAKIGEQVGYKVYADLPNYRTKLQLPNVPQQNIDRIQEIDVLWLDDGQIAYEFEVENTTGITEAFVRGSNILSTSVKRYIAIPEERQDFFYQRTSEPMIKERLEKQKWGFIFYDNLMTFHEKNKKKPKIKASDFDGVCSVLKLKTQKQQTITGK